jgi:hypothetical protein
MPNFAQEFPNLIFLPFIIFAATAAITGLGQWVVLMNMPAIPRRIAQKTAGGDAAAITAKPSLEEIFKLDSAVPAEIAAAAARRVPAEV